MVFALVFEGFTSSLLTVPCSGFVQEGFASLLKVEKLGMETVEERVM